MHPETETRRGGLGGAVFAVMAIALFAYLSLAALQGEHGLFESVPHGVGGGPPAGGKPDALRAERAAIANKTRRLSSEALDLDLLDEQARRGLGFGGRTRSSFAERVLALAAPPGRLGVPCSANPDIIEVVQG